MSEPAKPLKRNFDTVAQEAYLSLWRTYDRLKAIEDQFFAPYRITAQQYNVLRLVEASEKPMPTLAIAAKLVSRAPDITRMLDRLEKDGWITRCRSTEDRRTVLIAITPAGRERLEAMEKPLAEMHQRQLGHVDGESLENLCKLLSVARRPHEPKDSYW